MPKLNNATPKYCKHKASGQAVVTIAGRDHYLGPHGTKASKIEYDRLIGEWLAAGRPSRKTFQTNDLTVAELAAAYWKFANQYYRKNGKATMTVYGVKVVLKHLRTMYGRSSAEEFGPLALKAIRQRMVDSGLARTSVCPQSKQIDLTEDRGCRQRINGPQRNQVGRRLSAIRLHTA